MDGFSETADGPAIGVRGRAVPAQGQAKAAVRDALTGWFKVAKTSVTLITGAKSRVKSFALAGVSVGQASMIVTQPDSLARRRLRAVIPPKASSSQKDCSHESPRN